LAGRDLLVPPVIEEISAITAKGQTTIPKSVRRALGVTYGGKIAFRVDQSGVTVCRVDPGDEDPAIERFLSFLAEDIKRHPEALSAVTPALARRLTALIGDVDIDPDAPIDGDVDL